MTGRSILVTVCLLLMKWAQAQQPHIDSLQNQIVFTKNDTSRLLLFERLSIHYSEIHPDSAYYYASKMFELAKKLELGLEEVFALGEMSYAMLNQGNFNRSLQHILSAIALGRQPKSEQNILPPGYPSANEFTDRSVPARLQRLSMLSRVMQYAGILYYSSLDYPKSMYYLQEAIPLAVESKNLRVLCILYVALGRTYLALKQTDSALVCIRKSYDYAVKEGYDRYHGSIFLNMGRVYMAMKKTQDAKLYFTRALDESAKHSYVRGVAVAHLLLADIYKQEHAQDSVFHHTQMAMDAAQSFNSPEVLLRCYTAMADFYKNSGNSDSAVKFQSLIIKINDSLFNAKQVQQFQNIDFDARQRQQEMLTAEKDYQHRLQKYSLIAGVVIFLLAGISLWRSNRNRQKSNAILQQQNKEIEAAMMNLKAAQAQLIHAEKMASLGELTAGIAHEIQNPLNFVNNFSEVNKELLLEMKEEIDKGNIEEVKVIAHNIISNEEKISHHGQRADAIVKGMLQHSRGSNGVKEPTDINTLAEEYVRLAYHGLRAKDKSFNATVKTNFDRALGAVNVVPQDIGRVILNLVTNAFYAVDQKRRHEAGDYEPIVSLSTKRLNGKLEIKVGDNANGIPQKLLDKIFQPFFTTKPPGEGTGLGLSMAYEIITKEHGGDLKVETKENEGSIFIIQLPLS